METESTVNRFQRLLRNESLRAAFGQTEVSFDFGQALSEGAIVLVSLATEGGTVSQENARTFATLMLADLWTAAKERGKATDPKPFYLYIDEFQRFVTPTIAENLDEARGFGLHLTLAHQYPSQLIEASRDYGQRLYESVMENARSKVVFSLSLRERNLAPLADWLYSGTYDPSRVKHELHSTKVMGYSEETRDITARGTSRGTARSEARGTGAGVDTRPTRVWISGLLPPRRARRSPRLHPGGVQGFSLPGPHGASERRTAQQHGGATATE
jgi:hypothetical protein